MHNRTKRGEMEQAATHTGVQRGRRATGPADLRRALSELGSLAATLEVLRMDVSAALETGEPTDSGMSLDQWREYCALGDDVDLTRRERELDEQDARDGIETDRSDRRGGP